MGFAEERVFEHILKNLGSFRHIHVTSLAQSMSCLTESDRDELQAREEARGTQAAVFKFYQFIKCHRGWVTDLIRALHHNNAGHLAEELQRVYDRYRLPSGAPSSSVGAQESEAVAAPRAPADECAHQDPTFLPHAAHEESSAADRAASAPGTASESSTALGSATASESSMASDSRIPVQESLPKNPESPMPSGSSTSTGPGGEAAGPGRGWPGRQQHPVCVDDGYFGNTRHLSRGSAGSSLLPPPAPCTTRRNEPEEVHFVSAELPSGSVTHSPLHMQQQKLEAEQKRPGMLREQEGDGAAGSACGGARVDPAPPVSVPAATSTSSSSTLEAPVAAGEAQAGMRAGSAPSMPAQGEVHPASMAALPGSPAGAAQTLPGDAAVDAELSKPCVLLSMTGGHPAFPAPSGPYSGDSGRLEISSDPLLLSTDGSLSSLGSSPAPAPRAGPREEAAMGARSHPPPNWDDASLRTHELRVEHCPSVPLGAALKGDGPLGDPAAFVSTSSNSAQAGDPPGDVRGFSSSYIAPAAGVALISALAFLVYTRLQK